MADDINVSADQEENEDEMSTEELDALFDQDEPGIDEGDSDDDADDSEDQDDELDDDDAEGDDESADDEDDSDDDEEESDDLEDEDDDEGSDEEPDDIKAQAAALRQADQDATNKADAEAERAKNMEVAKADVLKELFSQDKIKIGDKEIDLADLGDQLGEEVDTLITARSMQIVEPLLKQAMENAGFASAEDLQKIKDENAEFRLMSEIAPSHPDIWTIKQDPKFWKFVDAGGEDVSTLMNNGGANGISAVVKAYKKATIGEANTKIDKAKGEKKKRHTDAHSSNLRSKGGKKSRKAKPNATMSSQEEEDLFNDTEVTD